MTLLATAQKYSSNVGSALVAKVVTSIHKFDYYLPKSPLISAEFNFTYPNKIESNIQNLNSSNDVGVYEIAIKVVKH